MTTRRDRNRPLNRTLTYSYLNSGKLVCQDQSYTEGCGVSVLCRYTNTSLVLYRSDKEEKVLPHEHFTQVDWKEEDCGTTVHTTCTLDPSS